MPSTPPVPGSAPLWPAGMVTVPLGLALLAAGRRRLPVLPGDPSRRFDLPGLLTLAAALGLLVVPLVLGRELHWPAWTWAALAGSALLFAAFALVEWRITVRGGQPLIPARVLRAPGLLPAAGAIFLIMGGFAGFMFDFALHQQAGLGNSALKAGLLSAPIAVGFGLSSLHWQRLPARLHGVLPVLGLSVAALGYLLAGLLIRDGGGIGFDAETVLVAIGLAAGCAYSPLFGRALGRVDPADAADASGVLVTVIQLGQVIGVAVLGAVLLGRVDYPAAAADSGRAFLTVSAVIAGVIATAAGCALTGRRAQRNRAVGRRGTD